MEYAVQTLQIELARLRRGIRRLETSPVDAASRLARLNRHVEDVREALRALSPDGNVTGRPMDGFPEYAVETLEVEAGRLMEVIRSLESTREEEGIRYPAARIALHERRLEEIRAAIPALERALEARLAAE